MGKLSSIPIRRKVIIAGGVTLFILLLLIIFLVVKRNHRSDDLILYGNVDVRQVDIGFRVDGKVADLFFEEGDFVAAGSLMATLEKTPYDSKVDQAAANVLATAVNLELAEILLKRRLELIDIGGVSQENVDDATANFRQLEANLLQMQAELAIAQDNLSYTEVYAPSDGIILTRIREPGSVVIESEPVYTLSISSPVWIRAYVDETQLGEIYFGMPAEVITDTKDLGSYMGKVGFISPIAEFTPKTVETTQLRTDLVYRLRIYVDNPGRYLKQGMPVTVKLKTSALKKSSS